MSTSIPSIPDLAVPAVQIMRQANGEPLQQLKLAAAWGYHLACQDLEEVTGISQRQEDRP